MRKKRGLSLILCVKLFWLTFLLAFFPFVLATPQDRTMIDPNKEKVIVSMRGVSFDIPLGYFFHDASFTRGSWPVPSKVRSLERSLVITAAIDDLHPWTRETAASFASGRGTMRIRLATSKPVNWLDNYMNYRYETLYESELAGSLDGLKGYGSKYGGPTEVSYLPSLPLKKPYLILRCGNFRSDTRMCEVTFDYRDGIVVEYALPVWKIKNWRLTHQSVVNLLNSFISN